MALPGQHRERSTHGGAGFSGLAMALVVTAIACILPGCHTWLLGADATAAGGGADAPPWNAAAQSHSGSTVSSSAAKQPSAGPQTATAKVPPPAASFAALGDPRWLFVADDSLNPLATPLPVDSGTSNAPSLNDRLRPHWHPPTPPGDPNRAVAPADRLHRWRHPGLESLLAQPAERRPDLHAALAAGDPVASTNAAILLARANDPAARAPLLRAIRSADTNNWQRQAAVEAFAELQQPDTIVELQRLVDELGKFSGSAAGNYQSDLHVELLRGLMHAEAEHPLVRFAEEVSEPRFAAALASPASNVRRTALVALANPNAGPLPANAVRFVGDPDSSVRRAALMALAARRHPEALELLRQARLDQDFLVRLAVVSDFGRLGGPEAIGELRRLASHTSELIRAAAVAALVQVNDDQTVAQEVAAAEGDKSWRVRRALVPILDRQQSPHPTALAERLVADPNFDVAKAAIESVSHWPLIEAGPILLDGMEVRSYQTRKAAAQQLAALWPPAAAFETEAIAPRRAGELEQLRQKWRTEIAALPPSASSLSSTQAATSPSHSPSAGESTPAAAAAQQLAVEKMLAALDRPMSAADRAATLRALAAVGPSLADVLQCAVKSTGRPVPEEIYRDVLPAVDPMFATLRQLSSTDPREWREAVETLKTAAASSAAASSAAAGSAVVGSAAMMPQQRLGDLALERLVAILLRDQQGGECWGAVLTCLMPEDREPAARLACAGLSHPAPDVRRLACELLARHPAAGNGPLLAKSLEDPIPMVVEAAVRAIGQLPSLEDPRPLEKILAADDHALRVEAAESLARLGYSSGVAALERLGYDAAPQVRRLAALAMGRIGDRSFVPALIHLLDDRPEICAAALRSLPRAAGGDLPPAQRLADGTEPNPAQRWKDWYAAGATMPGSR